MNHFLAAAHSSWHELLIKAFEHIDKTYLSALENNKDWIPQKERLLSAFSLPKPKVKYVLLGESPYPRPESANGYAFWDKAVKELWGNDGLSKAVNRATSLRNFIKMLLHAEGLLNKPFSQQNIQKINKTNLIQYMDVLYKKLLAEGFLLLNASLVWSSNKPVQYHAKHWHGFIQFIFLNLLEDQSIQFLLFGRIAQKFKFLPPEKCLQAEHPYVLSFIENTKVLEFFKPFSLLRAL
jgi:uracil-DNA glycosylase